MITIQVRTLFDVSATGVTGHYKSSRVPYQDRVGQSIVDQPTWDHSRNQQRNFETLQQLLSLRTQVFDITDPCQDQGAWTFEFQVESPGVYGEDDNFSVLYNDADGIPMLRNLNESQQLDPVLITLGPRQNIWFAKKRINIQQETQHE